MDDKAQKLIKILKLWLKKNELDSDSHFYSIEEWRERDEDYHNESEFVLITEGGLYMTFNWGEPDEFYNLVESFGYICELGHAWNMGFYKDEIEHESPDGKTYQEKLRDSRWQEKRKYILERADNKCEDCNSLVKLEIHHCYYIYGHEPWEYPFDALRCLCKECHKKRGNVEMLLRSHLAPLQTEELNSIVRLITQGLYWYPKEEMFALLRSFKHDQTDLKEIFSGLLSKRKKHK